MKKLLFLSIMALFLSGSLLANGPGNGVATYKIDSEKSQLTWMGKKITGKQHIGTIDLAGGSIQVDGAQISGSTVTMDMTSIACTDLEDPGYNQKLVGHLKSEDFFSVSSFPEASFEAFNFETIKEGDNSENNCNVKGKLTIKGITHEISFPAKVTLDNEVITALGTATIDRSKWDVKYGSGSFFEGLGDNLINDDIQITFDLTAIKTAN